MISTHRHNSSDSRSSFQRWLLGLLLCLGGALVWALLLSYVGAGLNWWFNRSQTTYESRSAFLRDNGDPCVAVQRYLRDGRDRSIEHQTVDGQPIVLEPDELTRTPKSWHASAFPTSYTNTNQSHALNAYNLWIDAPAPFPWSLSLLQFADGDGYLRNGYFGNGRQWYFRWPRRAGGSGFLEGFDLQTKRRVGFIGMSGFSETEPPAADQFPAWDVNKSATAAFITAYHSETFPPSPLAITFSEPGQSLEHGLWIVTPQRDRLFVINLTRRSLVTTRVLSGKLLGTSMQQDATGRSQEVTLALFWEDRLEIVSPTLKTLREIRFPKELHGKINSFSERPSGEFEASRGVPSSQPEVAPYDEQFVRFNDQGKVSLRRTVTLPPAKPWQYWSAEPYVLPLSLMPIGVVNLLAPYQSAFMWDENNKPIRQPNEPLTWSLQLRALRIIIGHIGWTFWLTLLSGLPFAALCVWRQRTLPSSHFDRVAWPLLLCVFGVVGWVAFRTHRRWPVQRAIIVGQTTTPLATT